MRYTRVLCIYNRVLDQLEYNQPLKGVVLLKKIFLLLLVIMFGLSPASAFAARGDPVRPAISGNINQPSVFIEPYGRTFRGVLRVSTHICSPGSTVTCTGTRFVPGSVVTVYLDGKPVGSTTADSRGRASFVITAPSGTNRGLHTITMQGNRQRGGTLVLMNKVYCFERPLRGFSKSDVSAQDFDKKQVDHQSAISMGMLVPLLAALAVILTTAGVGIKLLKK